MKKFRLFIAIALIFSIAVTGCGKIDSDTRDSSTEQSSETVTDNATSEKDSKTTDKKDTSDEAVVTPEPVEATLAPDAEYKDLEREVSILGLKEYKKIKGDKYKDKAPKGKKYLVLFLEINNRTEKKDYINVNYLTTKVDGKKIENTYLLNDPMGYSTIFTNINAGKTAAGFIVWEVPEDWKSIKVNYDGWKGSSGLTLKCTLTNKDLKNPEKYNERSYQ